MSADGDAYEAPPLEQGEGHDSGVAAALEEDDALLRLQPAVACVRGGEKRRARDVVVARVRVLAVGAGEAGFARQHETVRVAAPEVAPGDDPCGKLSERVAGVVTDERLAAELLPPRLRLAVVHDQVGVAKVAGGAERERAPAHAAVERDRGVAERAERDGHRDAADAIVDDLVPRQDLQWVGTYVRANREFDHRLAEGEPVDRGGGREARVVERRDAVLTGSTRLELGQRHPVPAEVGREPGADLGRRQAPLRGLSVTGPTTSRDEREKGSGEQSLHDSSLDARKVPFVVSNLRVLAGGGAEPAHQVGLSNPLRGSRSAAFTRARDAGSVRGRWGPPRGPDQARRRPRARADARSCCAATGLRPSRGRSRPDGGARAAAAAP